NDDVVTHLRIHTIHPLLELASVTPTAPIRSIHLLSSLGYNHFFPFRTQLYPQKIKITKLNALQCIKMSPPANHPGRRPSSPSSYNLEFRSISDDAWYAVRSVLRGKKLTLKYKNFGDDVFEPQSFSDLEELQEFKARFRSLSRQLRDSECKILAKGTAVSVSHSFHDHDNRFYDAVVDNVNREKHSFTGGKEICKCIFTVVWQSGPWKGCVASKRIENICMVQSESELDPAVLQFSAMVSNEIVDACSKLSGLLVMSSEFLSLMVTSSIF
ncbi:hypothetical protein LINPERPRIM_LOCUS29937, partial [Linum perenne]